MKAIQGFFTVWFSITGLLGGLVTFLGGFLGFFWLLVTGRWRLILIFILIGVIANIARNIYISIISIFITFISSKIHQKFIYLFIPLYYFISAIWAVWVSLFIYQLLFFEKLDVWFFDYTLNYGRINPVIVVMIGFSLLFLIYGEFRKIDYQKSNFVLVAGNMLFVKTSFIALLISHIYNEFILGLMISSLFLISIIIYMIYRRIKYDMSLSLN